MKRAILIGMVALALAAVPTTEALAQLFGPAGCCLFADSSLHTWYDASGQVGVDSGWRAAFIDAMNTDIIPTDMSGQEQASHSGSVDVHWWTEDIYPYSGLAGCVTVLAGDNTRCDHWHVRFHHPTSGNFTFQKNIACHELGHTVGLDHAPNTSSCMFAGGSVNFNSHDIWHINGKY